MLDRRDASKARKVQKLNGRAASIRRAKNIVLAGVKSVALHAEEDVQMWYLSSNFFFSEDDISKNRALACVQKFEDLNSAVIIQTITKKLTEESIFLFFRVFCEFGPEFTIFAVDGEEPHTGIVASISNYQPASVYCIDDERLEFQDGDPVVKLPKVLHFKPLKVALKEPGEYLLSDFSKHDRSPLLHLALQALDIFRNDFCRVPITCSEEDTQKLIDLVAGININLGETKLEEIDDKLLRHFANGSRAILFYSDWIESLPAEPLEADDLKPLNCRYDAQISVFGSKFQKKLEDAKILKFSCQNGKLTLTDDDVIEKKTEDVFNDDVWESLSLVLNALDNINARMLMDLRCVYFQKPLLESGTLGTKCNTQIVIPHLTENYGASRDLPERQAPMRTLHSSPHSIDHCLTWVRSEFEGILRKTPNEVNKFLSNPAEYASTMRNAGDAQARDLIERVFDCLDKERCETFEDCISWARLKFRDYFYDRVKQLTFTFPEDSITSSRAPFWSAPKHFPLALEFSSSTSGHLQFIVSASIL
ncbi:Ubiquitin-activating enzyme E1 1 [Platanthera guangdongensis]|uniref:Ubiquitin-activating enzyme E1 1 n=1 Tax=Platanthera guangdongensis TaxID=2320717 RepID=A0ABR2MWW1_9ASPA